MVPRSGEAMGNKMDRLKNAADLGTWVEEET
jgi:hypothetical protein